MAENPFLLPSAVKPKKYAVTLEPNLETFVFLGKVLIDLVVLKSTNELKFHAEDLIINSVALKTNDGILTDAAGDLSFEIQKEEGTATVSLKSAKLEPGECLLIVEFQGILNDNMVGFYRASYTKNGEKKYMATTQFEATEARKAIPCWDEPSLKATFDVTLIVPKGSTALSNMPEISRVDSGNNLEIVKFAESPIMSTYLLAFIVGDLEKITSKTREGVEVNVYATPGNVERGRFALEVATEIISFFSEYFGIEYPLPKADLVAVPDFAMGAMENWGLITFRDTALLVDATSSASACQRVAYVVSHELAHQWFGNLVTMAWWSDLWLNEGFATWVGWLGVDHVKPQWDVWTQFVSSDLSTALETDALLSSHPIEVAIKDPREIKQVFDALSYRKGASVVRQLEAALGEVLFKKGLRAYLQKHKYANAITGDLWESLQEASGMPVQAMMATWTQQIGFPLLSVSLETKDPPQIHLHQSRFLGSRAPAPEEDKSLWWIPVTAITGGKLGELGELKEVPTVVLEKKEALIGALGLPPVEEDKEGNVWVKLNSGQRGFYRVKYSGELWEKLTKALEKGQVPVIDRLGLLMDAFALARAGRESTRKALQLALSYQKETEYTVWSQLSADWTEVGSLLQSEEQLADFDRVGRKLFGPIVQSLGWDVLEGESHLQAMLRPLVLQRLGGSGHKETIEEAKKRFSNLQVDPKSVPGDLRRVVSTLAVKFGGREEFEACRKLYREATAPDFQMDCLIAMGQTRDSELVREFLEFGLNENEVRAQNVLYVFAVLSANRYGRDIQWNYVRENWGKIYARFCKSAGLIDRVVSLPLKNFCSFERADEAEEFFEANPVPEGKMELKRTLETVRSRAAWVERDLSDISDWLSSFT